MPKKPARAKTKLFCAKCRAEWNRNKNPAVCPVCREGSFGIAAKAHIGGKAHA